MFWPPKNVNGLRAGQQSHSTGRLLSRPGNKETFEYLQKEAIKRFMLCLDGIFMNRIGIKFYGQYERRSQNLTPGLPSPSSSILKFIFSLGDQIEF